MELWYTDQHTDNVRFSMKVEKELVSLESFYQKINLLKTYDYGKVLVLDGELMITERDEFIYHEMAVHVPMAVHPKVKKVLVIGGGDGGSARELTKYDTIEQIDVVEVDAEVVRICKEFFPEVSDSLSDKRVKIHFEEGIRFARGIYDEYDLIIVDCADPYGPAEGLFTREFYGICWKALKEDGILINQHESPYYEQHARSVQMAHKHIQFSFPYSTVYQCHIPSYPSGHWLFGFASKKYDPIKDLDDEKWNNLGIQTRYYNTKLHQGAFYLPNYVMELLEI
ncbi:polyamine aminopropyltransferase [Anaerosacchariphilus polymeriproducens]|uniref:Polyamine aminopropyltransferase n=1 Tax=Anaerosacchariphilus polymeriproducens TaxID=1812858 RepID=A0A371AW61_9FIRM|nr:polyamine aminopropyltransferase [Anaerosacchariphilus polymeriproducens]RDU23779.1 polyamine aminopropyltransferase [Anaerosacchariphilus polymeriproducens]